LIVIKVIYHYFGMKSLVFDTMMQILF